MDGLSLSTGSDRKGVLVVGNIPLAILSSCHLQQ